MFFFLQSCSEDKASGIEQVVHKSQVGVKVSVKGVGGANMCYE